MNIYFTYGILLLAAVSIYYNLWQRKQIVGLKEQASTDSLTGLLNRRAFSKAFARLRSQMEKADDSRKSFVKSLAILTLDIDKFKNINDHPKGGHDVGDKVLIKLADLLSQATRDYDVVARMGGEEFVILFPNVDQDFAVEKAEKIRKLVEKSDFGIDWQPVTISVGVTYASCDDEAGLALKKSDDALYEAKNTGRNRVVFV